LPKQQSPVYAELNQRWKSACRILLGGEVGELDDFAQWLYEYCGPRFNAKSEKSGKQVIYADARYSKEARWISFDEIDYSKRKPSLNINEIKDIDSIIGALSPDMAYAGNICLGNSANVEDSTTIIDSHYVYKSEWISSSKYVAYSTHIIGDYLFGAHCTSTNFHIRTNAIHSDRCVEASKVDLSSDIYFSHGLSSCQECMFSFNLRNKSHAIGNLILEKSKYYQIKQKLLSEMREMLIRDKRLPHQFEMFNGIKPNHSKMREIAESMPSENPEKTDKSVIEKAFFDVSAVIFGKPIEGIDRHSKWLLRNTADYGESKSCLSGKKLMVGDYAEFQRFPPGRMLSFHEADFIGEKLTLTPEEADHLSVKDSPKQLSHIAYFCPEWLFGNNSNLIDSPISFDATDMYRSIINLKCKKCAFGWWPRESEFMFGHFRVRLSSYCINCYHSAQLRRCFEVLEGRDSSDCFYCHNIENCHDCMFCFNAKNLKYAVANVELPREKYMEIKKKVLSQLNEEISKTHAVSLSIYSLPEKAKSIIKA
jgi:hypothetical protein